MDGPAREMKHPIYRALTPEFRQPGHGRGNKTILEQRGKRDFHPQPIPGGEKGSEGKGKAQTGRRDGLGKGEGGK